MFSLDLSRPRQSSDIPIMCLESLSLDGHKWHPPASLSLGREKDPCGMLG